MVLLKPPGESLFPYLTQFLATTCTPWPVGPSSVFKVSSIVSSNPSLISFHHNIFSASKRTLAVTLNQPGCSRIIFHLKVLDLIPSAKSLLPHKFPYPHVPGTRAWTVGTIIPNTRKGRGGG